MGTLKQAMAEHFFTRAAREQIVVKQEVSIAKSTVHLTHLDNTLHKLVFTPKDVMGNHIGPAFGEHITINVDGAASTASITDNLDGSYSQDIEITSNHAPVVSVSFAGSEKQINVTVVKGQSSLPWWCFVLALIAVSLLMYNFRRHRLK